MKDFVSRAMMTSMLEQTQLEELHRIEKLKGYLLSNWNIQKLFRLPAIRDRYCIPEDDAQQLQHNKRIENEIERLGLRATEVYEDRMDWWHMFDWNVWNSKDQIIWDCQGKSRVGNLKLRLQEAAI